MATEMRTITYEELRQAREDQEAAARARLDARPLTPIEWELRKQRVEQAIEARERDGDPKEYQRMQEERDIRMSPLGRYLAEDPKAFRMVVIGPDGKAEGDVELLEDMEAQASERRERDAAANREFRMMGINF